MVSTFLQYNLITRDMKSTLGRTADMTIVARDTAYYKENIGKVTTVDAFLDDYRLYSYAMKAHGLEDMTYAKAFMRKVLESDLDDDSSYANQLTDDRYRNFAMAFSFSQASTAAQTGGQEDALIGLYNQSISNLDSEMRVESAYFDAMTTKVKTVAEFLQNDRLREYTLSIFELDPDNYNYSEVSQALSSDLTDPDSYFNRVWQPTIDTADTRGVEVDTLIGKYNERTTSMNQITANNAAIVKADSDKITVQEAIDDAQARLADPNNANAQAQIQAQIDLLEEQMAAVEAGKSNTEASTVTLTARLDTLNAELPPVSETAANLKALTAEQTRIASASSLGAIYKQLAAAFDFNADGTMTAGVPIVNDTVKADLNELYFATAPRLTGSGALINRTYYEAHIGDFTNATDLLNNARMRSFIITAYGLPKGIAKADIIDIMKSDLTDPTSYANTKGGALNKTYKEIAAAFNFQADGTVPAGERPQTVEQAKVTADTYMTAYNDADDAADETLLKSYKTLMSFLIDADDFLDDPKLMKVALTAFNLEDEGDTKRKLKKVLTSDLSDPKSYANSLKDSRYTDLARAFNFKADGSIGAPLLAQSQSEILLTAKSYVIGKAQFGTEADKTKATEESKYYSKQMETVHSLDDLLKDRRLVDFFLTAAGIDPEGVTTDFVRKAFTSDLDDPESFVNTEADTRYRKIVASFNFDMAGNLDRPKELQIQTRRGLLETEDLYYNQTLEENEGADNAGVRLALYFRRMASGIGSAYDILADTALLQVIQTAFSIPEGMTNASVDLQYAYINRVLDIKDLQDPEKLEKLMNRFAALYDVENNTDSSPAVLLLSSSRSAGISADTLMTLSQLRMGG